MTKTNRPAANRPAANPLAANPLAANPPAANPGAANPPAANPGAANPPAADPPAAGVAAIAKPTPADLLAAAGKTIPDLVGPDLRVLFSGINPSLYSAATGHHFARPGNRFWPALHLSGFTERRLHPSEQFGLPELGLGITNVVARASARADELSRAELIEGGEILTALVARWRPRFLAVLGVTAYRTAFARPKAKIGPQPDRLADTEIWVLPNPSGLNAHYQVDGLAEEFARLREAASVKPDGSRPGNSQPAGFAEAEADRKAGKSRTGRNNGRQ